MFTVITKDKEIPSGMSSLVFSVVIEYGISAMIPIVPSIVSIKTNLNFHLFKRSSPILLVSICFRTTVVTAPKFNIKPVYFKNIVTRPLNFDIN